MALAPKDLILSPAELAEADRLEGQMDKYLKEHYVPGQKISIFIGRRESKRVVNEVIRRYKAVGWTEIWVSGVHDENLEFAK